MKKKDPDLKNLMRWVDSLPHSTGILACSDDRAKQLIDVCKRLEIKVPEEIAVLGVENDDMICDLCFPPISSMKLDLEAGGYATGVLIQKLLLSPDKGNNKHIAIKPLYVVTRRSSDIFAIEDPVLAKAINFIEAHKRELITPEIVAMDAHVSLRSLQRFFKNNIHSSISDEIKKIRVKSIKELLVETDKSISQIAVEFGYKDAKHLSRYFRTITGISPIDFRRGYSIGYLGRDSK
jgi:LacI family transcriptional regulator